MFLIGPKKRDKRHFEEMAFPHLPFLYNVALKYMGNSYDAEDLVQETMFAAFRNFRQLREESKCRGWLFAILRSAFLKEKRQAGRRPQLGREEKYLSFLEGVASADVALEVEQRNRDEIVRQVLSLLPEKYQTPLILFYLQDFSYGEISELLDLPMGTVMSRLNRGRKYLKQEMIRHWQSAKSTKIVALQQAETGRGE